MRRFNLWELIPMWMKMGLVLICGALVGGCLACSIPKFKSFTPDAPLEELFEDMIENYSGVDLDITPSSPERA